jgi:hypothetical protein
MHEMTSSLLTKRGRLVLKIRDGQLYFVLDLFLGSYESVDMRDSFTKLGRIFLVMGVLLFEYSHFIFYSYAGNPY